MDPTAVLTLSRSCVRQLQGLAQASDAVAILINEISDLSAVLTQVIALDRHVDTLDDPAARDSQSVVRSLLRRAEGELMELHEYLQQRIMRPSAATTQVSSQRVDRIAWITSKDKIVRMQQSIRGVRSDLTLAIGTASSHAVTRVELRLQSITTAMLAHDALLQQILRHQTLTSTAGLILTRNDPQGQTAQDTTDQNPPSDNGTRPHHGPTVGAGAGSVPSGIQITATAALTNSGCTTGCICACHVKRTYRYPSWLRAFFGGLFVGYAGLPALTPACTEQKCRHRSAPSIEVTYRFPTWFLSRVVSVYLRINRDLGPELKIRTSRLVGYGAPLWRHSYDGDLDAVQRLFSTRSASPYDVDPQGRGALTFSIRSKNTALCQMLLREGADKYLRDESGLRPIDEAWYYILSLSLDSATHAVMSQLFYDEEYMESLHFTTLHKVLLETASGSLEAQLELSTAQINNRDANGMTCLAWASRRGDADAVRLLLDSGADANISDNTGDQPLRLAVDSGSIPCVEMLLESCDEPGHMSKTGVSALYKGVVLNNLEAVKLLLGKEGVSVNAVRLAGDTPLHAAACYSTAEMVGLLLDAGADPMVQCLTGSAPIHVAVNNHNIGVLNKLIEHEVDFSLVNNVTGQSILHYAATYCTPELFDALRNAKSLLKIDTLATDKDGLTCFDIAAGGEEEDGRQRRKMLDEFLIDLRKLHATPDNESDIEDTFEDALDS